MSSVMHQMRLASTAVPHTFESRMTIARADAGPAEFLAFICTMCGWLTPFPRRLWSLDWPVDLIPGSRDSKRRWREGDIRVGSGESMAPEIPRARHMPKIDMLAERLGVAYVIEGAQMGSQVLRKTVMPARHPLAWLVGYGGMVKAKWLAFRTSAENYPLSRADRALAAVSALATVESTDGWFQKTGMA